MQSKYMKFNNPNGFEGDVSDDATMEQQSWIQAYLSRPESMFYCRVDESYIKDPFNLYDLREKMNIDNSRFRRLIHIITSSRRVEDILATCSEYEIEVLPTTPTFLRMMLMSGLIPESQPME